MTFEDAKEMLMTPEVQAEYDKLQKEYDEIRKQLGEPSPWHAGTPTKEERFLLDIPCHIKNGYLIIPLMEASNGHTD